MQDHAGDRVFEPVRRRMWLLMLLDAAEQSGLAPLHVGDVHRLAFFANCLAPVYDLPASDGEILKYWRGPYYPDVQWDVDRLVAQNLLRLDNVEYRPDEKGVWLSADYLVAPDGLNAVEHGRAAPQAATTYDFLLETAAAYASMRGPAREDAPFQDATFGNPQVLEQSLLDLRDEARNFSVRTATAFDDFVGEGVRLHSRDRLHLYFRYLDRMVAKAAS